MDEEQLRQKLDEARRLILAADARVRFYAFVPNVGEDELELARGDWYAADDIIWEVLKARAKDVRVIDSFTDVSGALSLLIDTLAVNRASPEQSTPPGAV